MVRINYQQLVLYFLVYVVLQLPLLYKFVLFDSAFGFFYLGFLLLLPFGINPFIRLTSGFFVGLLIDIFSNTPGLHAAAGTILMFIRDYWLLVVKEDLEDDPNLSVFRFGMRGTFLYLFPLIFLHLLFIFGIEHGKFLGFGLVLKRVFLSSLFTFICVVIFNFIMAGRKKRV